MQKNKEPTLLELGMQVNSPSWRGTGQPVRKTVRTVELLLLLDFKEEAGFIGFTEEAYCEAGE